MDRFAALVWRKPRAAACICLGRWGSGPGCGDQVQCTQLSWWVTVSWHLVSARDDGLVTRGITNNTTTTRNHSNPSANLTFRRLTFNWLDVFYEVYFHLEMETFISLSLRSKDHRLDNVLRSGIYLHMTLVSWKQATFFWTTFTFPNKSTWKINLLCICLF